MLVRFKSAATDSINMFGDSAQQLIKMLGGSGSIPGAITAADIPGALQRLRQQLQTQAAAEVPQASNKKDDEDDKDKPPNVALTMRAQPLIDLLERAGKAGEPVMWEAG